MTVYKQALCDESLAVASLKEAREGRTNPTVRNKQPSSWAWRYLGRHLQDCLKYTTARCAPNAIEGNTNVQWRQDNTREQKIGDPAWVRLRDRVCMKVFDAFDIDGDGAIDPKELQGVYKPKGKRSNSIGAYDALVDLVLAADNDENGKVTRTEWQDLMDQKRENEGAPSTEMLRLMKDFVAKRK